MLKGQIAIITGAARGIGRAIALELSTLGANIVVNHIGNKDEALSVVAECENMGVKAIAIEADVADNAQVEAMVKETMNTFGRVDILVNNAGITKDNLLMRMSEDDFDAVINTNLKGAFICMKQVNRIMLKQRYGRIINISSVVGISGNPGQTNYAASKAGIIGMTKTVAKEMASRGITVNAIAPGFIKTKMTEDLPANIVENLTQNIPLGKLGEPCDIARTVAFLAGVGGRYITGQVLCVDGGMVM
ncbi:MAG: 3-oxoacyl-[acyl-carrier-protein] reductase [Clostridiales bacterium]